MRLWQARVLALICAMPAVGVWAQAAAAPDGPPAVPEEHQIKVLKEAPGSPAPPKAVITGGGLLTRVPPVYPPDARAGGVEGAVVVRAVIAKDGHIKSLGAISGPEMLRPAATDAVRQWTYKPFLRNGEPAEMLTTVTVNFNLHPPSASTAITDPGGRTVGGGVFGGMAAGPARLNPQGPPIGPRRIASGVMQGQLLNKVQPVYPPSAKKDGIEGTVVLHAIIGKDGHIQKLQAISGPDELRDAALDAVGQWAYRPYLLNGEPAEVDTTVIVNFTLAPRPTY